MSSKTGIAAAVAILQRVFTRYTPDGPTLELVYDLTGDIADLELADGARHLCATETRQPANMIAALRAAALEIRDRRRAEASRAQQDAEQGRYITYWERSPEERKEIDEAREECMRVVRALGVDTGPWSRAAVSREK